MSKCDALKEKLKGKSKAKITTAQVDADKVTDLVELIRKVQPDVVLNLALPYQDLTIMEACLKAGVNYLDTANYEPKDEAHFEYSWQWLIKKRFEDAGLTAILGCGFDPGVSGIYTATQQNIILTRCTTWILWTVMPATITKRSLPILILKSISAKLLRTDVIMKKANG